jgi:glucoamylase
MPLCWSHAEYISLVRSAHDGVCFDRVEPAFERFVARPVPSRHEIWSLRHPIRFMPQGKILRLILAAEATVVWSDDRWKNIKKTEASSFNVLNLWFADFPTNTLPDGSVIEFTLFWKETRFWEGRDYSVSLGRPK